MNRDYKTLGGLGFIFRNGSAFTVPTNGTASRSSKPGATDPAWFDLGHIDLKFKNTTEKEEIYRPSPGKRVLYKVRENKRGIQFSMKCYELSNLTFELMFGTLALPNTGAGGQYNPLEGKPFEAWLKLQQYDADDNSLVNTIDAFCYFEAPSELDFGDKKVECEIQGSLLFSPLNTGTLA